MKKDQRIVEDEGIGLDEILEKMQREHGKVVHNSFLENIEESAMESILSQPLESDIFNHMVD